ncbi:MAG: GNAT family N-acetyltransferase [Pirellulaceae bacterium]
MDLRPTSYPGVLLRASHESDYGALYRIFTASQRELMEAIHNLEDSQRESLMGMQFEAQQIHYRTQYPGAIFNVVVANEQVIGNFYTFRKESEVRLIDISLLPEYRNRGIGHALLKQLLDQSAAQSLWVSLHVSVGNPAIRLYERLGFISTSTHGVHVHMQWAPPSL